MSKHIFEAKNLAAVTQQVNDFLRMTPGRMTRMDIIIVGDVTKITIHYDALGAAQAAKHISIDTDPLSKVLFDLGIPAHIKGFRYTRYALELLIKDSSYLDGCMTTGLYPEVAQKFDTTPSRVERAIRHGIELAWPTGKLDQLHLWEDYKPATSEFLATLVEKLHLNVTG